VIQVLLPVVVRAFYQMQPQNPPRNKGTGTCVLVLVLPVLVDMFSIFITRTSTAGCISINKSRQRV
jgi:hypothetical protein